MYTAFTYEENTHNKIFECFGNTKAEAAGMFFSRTKGEEGLTCFLCEVDENKKPIGGIEIVKNWL